MTKKTAAYLPDSWTRRDFLHGTATAGSALAVLSAAGYAADARGAAPFSGAMSGAALRNAPRAPFDSLRDWIAALDAHGLLMRFERIDQDRYHMPALFYHATDKYTMYGAPCMLFEEVRIDGRWVKGPVILNAQGHWYTDALIWGLPITPGDHFETYRTARRYMQKVFTDNGGDVPEIPPVEVARDRAPCKQVVLNGDEIDITRFPFVQTNPADGGRYVNTGSHFMVDPEFGPNFGTYRCQIKGPRKLVVNPEPNQTGYKMIMAARERGETEIKYSIVLGQDPVVWLLSGTRIAPRGFGPKPKPADELAMAGGLRGKPVEVVKSENTNILIPAHAEFVIEGTLDIREESMEQEGPFGEMFGYLGPLKPKNFPMRIDTITHRENPWFVNAMTGMQRGMVTAPMDAAYSIRLKEMVPQFVEYTNYQDMMGVIIMSIDKTGPGQGLQGGLEIAKRNPIAKIVIVVDKDIDILDKQQVLFAVGSRWQPYPASQIIEKTLGLQTDPSQVEYARTSKIVIDATRQLPGEGGKADFPKTNRELLMAGAPDSLAEARELFGEALAGWKSI